MLLGGVAIAGTLGWALGRVLPNLRRVAVTDGGCGRLHAVVALADPAPGDARRAMFAAWAAVSLVKTVTVVVDDVDPDDPADVERAVATRLRAARDWPSYHRIVAVLRELRDDETLVVQSGKPIGVFPTHPNAPVVVMACGNLVGRWATPEQFYAHADRGLTMWGGLTAGDWQYIGSQGCCRGPTRS